MTPVMQQIKRRLRDRARQYLGKTWQRHVDVGYIAWQLARSLPGDLRDYEIDHVRPLASFDFSDMGQIREAFAAENHQWLRSSANRSKGAR